MRGMKVKVIKDGMRYRGDNQDDVLAVYLISDGVVGCKVRFLAQHSAVTRVDDYNGLIIHVVKVYLERCNSIVKCNKMHQNEGCCIGKLLGNCKCLEHK